MTHPAKDQIGDQVTSGLRWATASRLLTQIVTWGTTFLVVRLLLREDYGLATMAALLAGYLALWNELGFSVALVQRKTVDVPTLRTVFGLLLVIGLGLCLLMVLAAPLVADAFGDQRIIPLTRLVALTFIIMPFVIIPHAQLSIAMNMRALSLINLAAAVVGAAVTLSLALGGAGPYALVLGPLALSLTRAVLLNLQAPFLHLPAWRPGDLRSFMSFSAGVMLNRTIWYWYSETDTMLVGRLMGADALGSYGLGRQLATMPMERISEVGNMVGLPAYSNVNHDLAQVRSGYINMVRLVSVFAFPIFWGMALVADELVRAVLTDKWLPAVPILQLMCVAMPLRTIGTLTVTPLMALGRIDKSLRYIALPAVLVPVAIVIGVRYGVAGAALAWAVAYPVAFFIATLWVRRTFAATAAELLLPMLAPALAAACMYIAGSWLGGLLPLTPLALLLVKFALGVLLYVAALALLSRAHLNDAVAFTLRFMGRR